MVQLVHFPNGSQGEKSFIRSLFPHLKGREKGRRGRSALLQGRAGGVLDRPLRPSGGGTAPFGGQLRRPLGGVVR